MKTTRLNWTIFVGGIIGLTASFLETLEYIKLLKNPNASLTCNLNSVFSCSNVLHAWQSRVFGFPNSIMCMSFFTAMAIVGLAGLSSERLVRAFRLGAQAAALFFLGFGIWFLEQSTFQIKSLCILCLFCFSGLLLINAGLMRLNATDLPISNRLQKRLQSSFRSGADLFFWLLVAVAIGCVMFLKF